MNLLTIVPWLTQLIPGRGTVYLLLGAIAAGFAGGVYVTTKFWDASELAAVQDARTAERDAALLGNDHEKGALERARQRKEQSDALLEDLRLRLAHGAYCNVPVPREWVRSTGPMPRAPADPGRPRPADPPLDPAAGPVADAGQVVLTCERNRLEAYQPEADDRAAIRAWYNGLRQRLNR